MNWHDSRPNSLAITMSQLLKDADASLSPDQRLKAVAQSLATLVQELEAAIESVEEQQVHDATPLMLRPANGRSDYSNMAQRTYRNRRRRAEIFADDTLFGEPAWDILLDLFVAAEKGKQVAVTSACIGSGVPSTTALRWLNVLEMRGLVEREDDNQDARRSFVRLTAKARNMMSEYFRACQE